MPRDPNGNYTLPAGNPVVSDTTIEASWANPTMSDLASEMSNSLSRTGKGGMLVPIKFVDGGVSDPAVTFTSEPTSGLYREAGNDIRMAVAAVGRMRWTATGVDVWDAEKEQWNPVLGGGIAEVSNALVGSRVQLPPEVTAPSASLIEEAGATLSRDTYKFLWDWAEANGLVVTETEWQATVSASPIGACTRYSSGDGVSTFRPPTVGSTGGVMQAVGTNGVINKGTVDGGFDDLGGTTTADPATNQGSYYKSYIYTGNTVVGQEIPTPSWLAQQLANTNAIAVNQGAIANNTAAVAANTSAINELKQYPTTWESFYPYLDSGWGNVNDQRAIIWRWEDEKAIRIKGRLNYFTGYVGNQGRRICSQLPGGAEGVLIGGGRVDQYLPTLAQYNSALCTLRLPSNAGKRSTLEVLTANTSGNQFYYVDMDVILAVEIP